MTNSRVPQAVSCTSFARGTPFLFDTAAVAEASSVSRSRSKCSPLSSVRLTGAPRLRFEVKDLIAGSNAWSKSWYWNSSVSPTSSWNRIDSARLVVRSCAVRSISALASDSAAELDACDAASWYITIDPRHGFPLMTRPTTEAISPFFIVSNVDRTIEFYRDKLGFETTFRQPDRSPFFAIVVRDGAQLFVESDKAARRCRTASVIPPCAWDAYVYAPDPDALAANLPNMALLSARRLRIPTTVCAASRFPTLTVTSCSSAGQSNGSIEPYAPGDTLLRRLLSRCDRLERARLQRATRAADNSAFRP